MTVRGRRPVKGERGAALLEAAMTLPLLLLVSVAIFEFGRAYQTWEVLTNAAREGARVAVLPNPVPGDVESRVNDYMNMGGVPSGPASITVDRNVSINIGATTATGSSVTVDYPFSFIVLQPVANLVVRGSLLGASPIIMQATAVMRNEQD